MRLTLSEILHTCKNWDTFCEFHGYSLWAVNEGGGDVEVFLSENQAHHLGIVKLETWRVEPFEEVYPPKTDEVKDEVDNHHFFG